MAKSFQRYDADNAETHRLVYEQRKKDAKQLSIVLHTITKRKQRVISRNEALFSNSIPRIEGYEAKLKQL